MIFLEWMDDAPAEDPTKDAPVVRATTLADTAVDKTMNFDVRMGHTFCLESPHKRALAVHCAGPAKRQQGSEARVVTDLTCRVMVLCLL
jgi:hypothetical protein